MRLVAGSAERAPVISSALVLGALALLSLTVFTGSRPLEAAPVIALTIVFAVAYRTLLAWDSLLAVLLLVILFVPMQRYVLPGTLPFELEPYRLLVVIIFAGWLASLLVDPRVRLRRSGFEAPILLLLVATFGSILANGERVAAHDSEVAKAATFFVSFLLIFYFIVSVVTTRDQVDRILKILVGGSSVLAVLAIVESRTGFNLFNHLSRVVPLLEEAPFSGTFEDDRGLRAYGSAQHPIALGAALVLVLPLAVYLIRRTAQRRWWLAAGLLALGSLATISRTSVLMLGVVAFVFLRMRPVETRRLWPLVLPALVAIHFVIPGTLGTLKSSFFPSGGLVAEQSGNVGSRGQGRLADIGPTLSQASEKPLFGYGYGTLVVDHARQNAQILDDQWLGTLLEAGLVGAVGWLWLFTRAGRRLARRAKGDDSEDGWLLTGLTAAVATFAVGMLTYDAFAFIQVVLLLFVLLALGAVTLRRTAPEA